MIRRQLPVYSPVTLLGISRAGTALFRRSERDLLREELATRYDARRVELWGSGTQALQVAISVAQRRVGAGPREGAPVALPAFQCYDLVSAAVGAGVRVAFYDVDPGTLAPDLDSLRRTLVAGARTVVIAPLYGVPVPWDSIAREVEAAGGVAIEDAAQGHGASWKSRPLGSWGPLSVLSFGRGKGWCGGSGGALLARDGWERQDIPTPGLPGVAAEARVVVQLKAQWILGRPALYGIPAALPGLHLGETVYHPPRRPHALARGAAAAVRAHRSASDREAEVRRTNARILHEQVPAIGSTGNGVAGFLRLPVRIPAGTRVVPSHLGVARSYPTTLAGLAPVRDRLVDTGPWPGAETLARELVTLPVHSRVTEADRRDILDWLSRARKGQG